MVVNRICWLWMKADKHDQTGDVDHKEVQYKWRSHAV